MIWPHSVREKVGLVYARGCEVFEVLDEGRSVVDERNPVREGHMRTFRVWLDTNQYQQGKLDCPLLHFQSSYG